jgi:hypothetical protein
VSRITSRIEMTLRDDDDSQDEVSGVLDTFWRRERDYRRAARGVPYCCGSSSGGRVELSAGGLEIFWRRERDSNSRYRFRYNGFQDRRLQPLGHPSSKSV